MKDFKNMKKKVEAIEAENEEYLKWFEEDLKTLSPKTIRNHLNNVRFYLNEFVAYRNGEDYTKGITLLNEYFSYFFVRKCLWASPAAIKSTAAGIRKFYKCMLKHEKITQENYDDLCRIIKSEMDSWCDECNFHDYRF